LISGPLHQAFQGKKSRRKNARVGSSGKREAKTVRRICAKQGAPRSCRKKETERGDPWREGGGVTVKAGLSDLRYPPPAKKEKNCERLRTGKENIGRGRRGSI